MIRHEDALMLQAEVTVATDEPIPDQVRRRQVQST
jgi:hypothetical protein